jgi:hypothetical protein
MRSSAEGGVAVVHLESIGDVANAIWVKYIRELRVGHRQRKACERGMDSEGNFWSYHTEAPSQEQIPMGWPR